VFAADDSVPFWTALLIGGAMIAAAVAMIVIGNMAATGRIGPNPGVGIRTKDTRRSEKAWQAAHVAAKPFVQFGAVVMIACGCVVFALSSEPAALYGIALVGVVLMAIAMLLGTVAANRAACAV